MINFKFTQYPKCSSKTHFLLLLRKRAIKLQLNACQLIHRILFFINFCMKHFLVNMRPSNMKIANY